MEIKCTVEEWKELTKKEPRKNETLSVAGLNESLTDPKTVKEIKKLLSNKAAYY